MFLLLLVIGVYDLQSFVILWTKVQLLWTKVQKRQKRLEIYDLTPFDSIIQKTNHQIYRLWSSFLVVAKAPGGVDLICFRCVLPDLEILKNTWHFNAGAVHPSLPSNRINTPNKSKEIEETWRIGALPVIDLSEQSPSLSIWAKNFMKCLWFFLPVPFFRCCILMQVQSSDGTMVSPRFFRNEGTKTWQAKAERTALSPNCIHQKSGQTLLQRKFSGSFTKV